MADVTQAHRDAAWAMASRECRVAPNGNEDFCRAHMRWCDNGLCPVEVERVDLLAQAIADTEAKERDEDGTLAAELDTLRTRVAELEAEAEQARRWLHAADQDGEDCGVPRDEWTVEKWAKFTMEQSRKIWEVIYSAIPEDEIESLPGDAYGTGWDAVRGALLHLKDESESWRAVSADVGWIPIEEVGHTAKLGRLELTVSHEDERWGVLDGSEYLGCGPFDSDDFPSAQKMTAAVARGLLVERLRKGGE